MYIHIYIYIHTHVYISAASARARGRRGKAGTVGFHNFNLRIFNLRVSNPNKLIVDVLTRCRISMCQGLGPKQHDEISEIDRSGDGAERASVSLEGTKSAVLLMYYIS